MVPEVLLRALLSSGRYRAVYAHRSNINGDFLNHLGRRLGPALVFVRPHLLPGPAIDDVVFAVEMRGQQIADEQRQGRSIARLLGRGGIRCLRPGCGVAGTGKLVMLARATCTATS